MSFNLLLHLIISLLCLKQASAVPSLAKKGCTDRCGDVSIPYPFGIGKDCYFSDHFSIHCNHSSTPSKPFLNHTKLNLELLDVSLDYKTVMVNNSITPLCENNGTWRSPNVGGSPFRFSSVHNMFMVVGCDTNAVLIAADPEEILAGCTSNCNSGITRKRRRCYGIQCCQTTIPYDNQSTHLGMYGVNYTKTSGDCAYAFLGSREWYATNRSDPAASADSGYAPVVMFWEMETTSLGMCYTQNLDWQSGKTIEICSCEHRYEGNPYLPNGCQGMYSSSFLQNFINFYMQKILINLIYWTCLVVEACANCSLLECGMIGSDYHCFPSNKKAEKLKAMVLGKLQFSHLKN